MPWRKECLKYTEHTDGQQRCELCYRSGCFGALLYAMKMGHRRNPLYPVFKLTTVVKPTGETYLILKTLRLRIICKMLAKSWLAVPVVAGFGLHALELLLFTSVFPFCFTLSRSWVLCLWMAISTSGKLSTTCAR